MSKPAPVRWLTAQEQHAWRAHLRVNARMSELLDADLRAHGLDLAEYEILVSLEEVPDRQLRMSELAEAVHQSRSRLTHTVGRMENQGLVERVSCPSDRRGVWAHLTEHGLAVLVQAAPSHVERVREHFVDPIPAGDLDALDRAYDAMLTAIDRTQGDLEPVSAEQRAPAGHRA